MNNRGPRTISRMVPWRGLEASESLGTRPSAYFNLTYVPEDPLVGLVPGAFYSLLKTMHDPI
jgi:hypothetical protein